MIVRECYEQIYVNKLNYIDETDSLKDIYSGKVTEEERYNMNTPI